MGERLDAQVEGPGISAVVVPHPDRVVVPHHSQVRYAVHGLVGKEHPEADLKADGRSDGICREIAVQNGAEPPVAPASLGVGHWYHLQSPVVPFVNKVRVMIIFFPVLLLGHRQAVL